MVQATCGSPDPFALIEEDHALQLELCDLLECLADGLPDFNRAIARSAAAILRQGFKPHLQLEEDMLFPLLRRRAPEGSPLRAIMQQLEAEHAADEGFAHELADELQLLADTGFARNAEMLGYMLRGFFEHQRRHIEWENCVLLPLARQTLTAADLAELQDWIMSQRKARMRQAFGGRAQAHAQRARRPAANAPRALASSISRSCSAELCEIAVKDGRLEQKKTGREARSLSIFAALDRRGRLKASKGG